MKRELLSVRWLIVSLDYRNMYLIIFSNEEIIKFLSEEEKIENTREFIKELRLIVKEKTLSIREYSI